MYQSFSTQIYQDKNGNSPYLKWFKKLKNKKDAARIEYRIRRYETDGSYGVVKLIGEGVYEFKFYFGPGYRVYFGKDNEKMILLLVGGDKATQKRDVKRAFKYWNDYKERRNDEKFSRFTH